MSFQKLTLVGYVGNISELKYTQEGAAVVNFSLAVNKSWTDKDGKKQEQVTWYRVACWRKTAETVAQYVTKGKLLLVEGDGVRASVYTAQDGTPRASLEVTASTVRFLGGKSDGERQPAHAPHIPDEVDDIPF